MAASAPTEEEVKQARKAYEKAAKDTERASAAAAKEKGRVTALEETLLKKMASLLDTQELSEAEALAAASVSQLAESVSSIDAEIQKIVKSLARRELLDSMLPKKEQTLASLEAMLSSGREELATATASIQSITEQISGLSAKLPFESRSAAMARRRALDAERLLLQISLEKAEQTYASCKDTLTSLTASIAQLQAQTAETPQIDMEILTQQKIQLTARKAEILVQQKTIHNRLTVNTACRKNIRNKSADLSALEEKQKWIRALSDTANGNVRGKDRIMLETYIQTTYFDRIVARANVRLMKMTGGQYDLKRRRTAENMRSQSGLELDVIDHYNGTERSVKTLSGGESFKASLALALGLSDEVQMSTGIQLDTLFVDEGFGSLDPESLNQAYNTLAGLTEGNRLVGIISHVAELKERIDRQIVVTKEKCGGSKATIIK